VFVAEGLGAGVAERVAGVIVAGGSGVQVQTDVPTDSEG
jgi:hypothetical protein